MATSTTSIGMWRAALTLNPAIAKSVRLVLFILLCIAGKVQAASFVFAPGAAEDEAAVATQVKEVLRLLDAGEAGAAWDDASTTFR